MHRSDLKMFLKKEIGISGSTIDDEDNLLTSTNSQQNV